MSKDDSKQPSDVGNETGGNDRPNPSAANSGDSDGIVWTEPAEQSNPAAGTGGASDGSNSGSGGKRGRGRPRGSGNRGQKTASARLDINGVEGLLLSIHLGISAFAKAPEMMLAPDEAHKLAEAIARVSAHYNLGASQKTLDWGSLFTVCAAMYGPRFAAIYLRIKSDAAKPVNPQPAQSAPQNPAPKKGANDPNIVEIPGVGSVRVN